MTQATVARAGFASAVNGSSATAVSLTASFRALHRPSSIGAWSPETPVAAARDPLPRDYRCDRVALTK